MTSGKTRLVLRIPAKGGGIGDSASIAVPFGTVTELADRQQMIVP